MALRSRYLPANSSDESDSSDDEKPWKRKCNTEMSVEKAFVNPLAGQRPSIKPVKFNVWSNVITDQAVSGELGGFDIVDEKVTDTVVDRGPESFRVTADAVKKLYPDAKTYQDLDADGAMGSDDGSDSDDDGDDFMKMLSSYKKAKDDWQKTPADLRQKIKQKRRHDDLRRRLDQNRLERDLKNPHAVFTSEAKFQSDLPRALASDSSDTVLKCIMDTLQEKKEELFRNIVENVGHEKALELLNKTEDVENAGGLMINSGTRRRTPGGVFIQLLRGDPACTPEMKKLLFPPREVDKEKKKRRKKAARRFHRRLQAKDRDGEFSEEMKPEEIVLATPDLIEMTRKKSGDDDVMDSCDVAEDGEIVSD